MFHHYDHSDIEVGVPGFDNRVHFKGSGIYGCVAMASLPALGSRAGGRGRPLLRSVTF